MTFEWLKPDTVDSNLATTISDTVSNLLQSPTSVPTSLASSLLPVDPADTIGNMMKPFSPSPIVGTVDAMKEVAGPIGNPLADPVELTPLGDPSIGMASPAPTPIAGGGGNLPIDFSRINQLEEAYNAPPPGPVPGRPEPIGVKGAMKNAFLSLIPIAGPAIVGPGIAKRNQQKADWQLRQNQANEQYKQKQQMLGEMLKDQYKQTIRTQDINRYMNYFLSPMGGALSQVDALRNATALAEGHEIPALQGMKSVQIVKKDGTNIIGLKDASGHYFQGGPVGGGVVPLSLTDIKEEYDIGVKPHATGGSQIIYGKINGKPAQAVFNPYDQTLKDFQGNDVSKVFIHDPSGGNGLAMQYRDMLVESGVDPMEATKRALTVNPVTSFGLAEPGRQEERVTRSYQYHTTQLEKVRKPLEDSLDRFSRLEETIAQNTAQADALVAPELLTVMAGGMGSGLRMNEAEIARIIGGRSKWETLKAKLSLWQQDPSKARSITPEQSNQIRSLMAAVRKKSDAKQFILAEAQDALMNSNDVAEHRRIYSQAKNDIFAIGQGNLRIVNGQIFDRQKDGTWLPRKAKP